MSICALMIYPKIIPKPAQMINKQCRTTIEFLLIILVLTGCNPPKNTTKSENRPISEVTPFNTYYHPHKGFTDREFVKHFFYYRKYVDGEKTCKLAVSAVVGIRDKHMTTLRIIDHGDFKYIRPYFLNNKDILFRDSSLTMLWGKGYTEVLADFKAEIGDTLKSKVSSGWIFNKRDLYFGLPLYEMGNVLPGTRIPQRIQYVHNLGFILHEVSYADSTIAWKLETINGVPFDTIAINFPEVYEYF